MKLVLNTDNSWIAKMIAEFLKRKLKVLKDCDDFRRNRFQGLKDLN